MEELINDLVRAAEKSAEAWQSFSTTKSAKKLADEELDEAKSALILAITCMRFDLAAARADLQQSERQRKLLAEQLEIVGRGGIEAATGAGK